MKLWMQATDRQAVTDSTNRIDDELKVDADQKGVPFGMFYVYYDDPLAVLYEVVPDDALVRVLDVKRVN